MGNNTQQVLNREQYKAVQTAKGQMLVLAGAGSGKTRVIISKIAHILEQGLCHGGEILAITFTNKAAEEMRNRVQALIDISPFWICTFHRMGSRMLRMSPEYLALMQRNTSFTIFDSNAQLRIIRHILKQSAVDYKKRPEYSPPAIVSMVRSVKRIPHLPEDIEQCFDTFSDSFKDIYRSVYADYQQALQQNNAFDFDDLILVPYQLFMQHKNMLRNWKGIFKYLFVDEFQDTNDLQYELIRLLGKDMEGITVVGDDDQTIYSWRGAVIENFVRFQKDFPEQSIVKLEENYRSHNKILQLANSITHSIVDRYPKRLFTSRSEGEEPAVIQLKDEKEEGTFVAERIQELHKEHDIPLDEMAVFCRTNWQFRNIEDCLRRYHIPYQVIGNIKFYERREIRILMDYLQFLVNPENLVVLRQIINTPSRYIGDRTWERFLAWLATHSSSVKDFCKTEDPGDEKLFRVYDFLKKMYTLHEEALHVAPHIILEKLLSFLDYKNFITQYVGQTRYDAENRWENVEKFISDIKAKNAENSDILLADIIEEFSLLSDADEIEDNKKVHIMTMHCAKGLEYHTVIITGMEDGILPHHRTMTDDESYEEEKRLFYVAVTRAKDILYLTSVKKRWLFGNSMWMNPSPFLEELDEDYMKIYNSFAAFQEDFSPQAAGTDQNTTPDIESLSEGAQVIHPMYGKGVIILKRPQYLKIRFQDQEERLIDPYFTQMKYIGRET